MGHWRERELAAGEVLWYESDPAGELALVKDGRLEVVIAGQCISEVGPGELVGEAAAFLVAEKRTAGVRASGPTRLLVLPQSGLAALRQQGSAGSDAYDALLDSALVV